MKIKIKENASELYANKYQGKLEGLFNIEWFRVLKKIEGMVLEVDTKYLFKDQYNTVPVEGVSDAGLRIMDDYVECVIDDERQGKARCLYCGKTVELDDKCNICGSFDLEVLKKEDLI